MCGIAGYIGTASIAPRRISAALELMENRGPDHRAGDSLDLGVIDSEDVPVEPERLLDVADGDRDVVYVSGYADSFVWHDLKTYHADCDFRMFRAMMSRWISDVPS